MRRFAVDLHVHTCLSPCGASSMIPPAIVEAARRAGLAAIGVTDHNSSENVAAVAEAGSPDIVVFGGMEMTTAEEIHMIGLFPTMEALEDMQRLLYEHLPGRNDPERFGPQYIVDHEGYITGTNDRLLAGATDLPVERLVDHVHERGGIAVGCHVDRESFSLTSQLGFIPDSLPIDAVELSGSAGPGFFEREYQAPTLFGSDAHDPSGIGSAYTMVYAAGVTFEEVAKALRSIDGRTVIPVRTR